MGRTNHHAGMHFIRYGRNHYDSYGYDRYAEIMAEHMMLKTQGKQLEIPKKANKQEVTFLFHECDKLENVNNIERYYKEAYGELADLYLKLYACAIKNHRNLKDIADKIIEYIETNTDENSVDDYIFILMASKMIGSNIGHLLVMNDEDIKEIVYNDILLNMNEMSITNCGHTDKADYIEADIYLMDWSREVDIKSYYLNLREALDSKRIDCLPNINANYGITLYRTKDENGENEYLVTVGLSSVDSLCEDNYLYGRSVLIYVEKSGNLANVFEKIYKEPKKMDKIITYFKQYDKDVIIYGCEETSDKMIIVKTSIGNAVFNDFGDMIYTSIGINNR